MPHITEKKTADGDTSLRSSQLPSRQKAMAYSRIHEYQKPVEQIRKEEYPHMDQGVYLDHSGATIFAQSLMTEFSKAMMSNLWGNPHSENLAAKTSGDMVDNARAKALGFLGADPEHYDLVFVANATAAVKLVADSFRDLAEKTADRRFWYGYHSEAHTSLIGVRELSNANYHCFRSDADVETWLQDAVPVTRHGASPNSLGLFAYPGQSNLSGRRLPKAWPGRIRRHRQLRNTYTLFDAAALAMTSAMSTIFADVDTAPDFTCLSLYKIFGFPDLGALVVRRRSGHILNLRKYFGGGTIAHINPLNGESPKVRKMPGLGDRHSSWDIHDGLEDGTLPFHNILALSLAMDSHERIYGSMEAISRHCSALARSLYESLIALQYANGQRVIEVYADREMVGVRDRHGATLAFNVLRADGSYVPWTDIERLANDAGVYIRAGGVCCPGGILNALKYEEWEWSRMFSSGHACGSKDWAVINGQPTGVVRASLGAMSTESDVRSLIRFLEGTFVLGVESLTS